MSTAFVSVPLFQGMDESGLQGLGEVFERYEAEEGEVLFSSGERAEFVYLLVEGSVALKEDGKTHIELQPVSVIGELGAMTGLSRRVTAVTMETSVLLRATGSDLMGYFTQNSQVAVAFYQNLLSMTADKVRRDERRINDMRHNIIATQKELKRLRDLILESPDTVVSEPAHGMLEEIISQNRRANYSVEPPSALPATIRLPDGRTFPVLSMSRQALVVPREAAWLGDTDWRGVLILAGIELPTSGAVESGQFEGTSRIELDLLIDEYSDILEDYLTQAQLLDIVL
jgi:CRP-like cAMP-binding protein